MEKKIASRLTLSQPQVESQSHVFDEEFPVGRNSLFCTVSQLIYVTLRLTSISKLLRRCHRGDCEIVEREYKTSDCSRVSGLSSIFSHNKA